jgi:hypothetical protein
MSVQSPPPYAPPQQPQKKGMGALGWIAIGCGVIVLLVVVVLAGLGFWAKQAAERFKDNPGMAAAELAVKINPDLDLVSKDEKAGTITVHNKKDGQTVTFNVGDVKNGHFQFSSDKGSASFDMNGTQGMGSIKVTDDKGKQSTMNFGAGAPSALPSWVPQYPGGTTKGSYSGENPQAKSGGFTVEISDSVDKTIEWYEGQLKSNGFKTQKATYSANASSSTGGTVGGTSDDQKRTVQILVSSDNSGKTHAVVTYSEKS